MSIINKLTALYNWRKEVVLPSPVVATEVSDTKRRVMPRTIRENGAKRKAKESNHFAKTKKQYNIVKDRNAGRTFNKGVRR